MSIKIGTFAKTALAMIGTIGLNSGLLATTAAGLAVGAVSYHVANPKPVQCDGTCAPQAGYVCGLNGQNYVNEYLIPE